MTKVSLPTGAVTDTVHVVVPAAASDTAPSGNLREAHVVVVGTLPVGTLPTKGSDSLAAEKVDFNQLPPPVKETVQAQRGTDVITAINSDTENSRTLYHVQFKGRTDIPRPELVVASDGTILHGRRASKSIKGAEVAVAPANR